MSRNSARPVKKPISVANIPEKQAATALDHLERGRFRDAMESYKSLIKIEPRPEWLAGLASAYAGRAQVLADKGMRREAIELWRNRAEICHTALWEGPYADWLVAEGSMSEVLGYLSKRRAAASAAPDGKADDGLAALEAQLAPGLLSVDDATLKQLPAESLLLQHRPLALAALAAYARQDVAALEEALAGISFRSPYRDLRSLLKAMVLWETDRDAARGAIDRVPRNSPFESLAAPLRSVVASGSERLRRWASLNSSQQLIALDLLGCPRTWAPMLQALAGASTDLAPATLFDLMQRNARVLPEALATRVWQWLAPWALRRGCASPLIFGKPSKADQECATALAVEIKGEWGHAEEHWLDAVDMLASSNDTDDRQRAAMVLRHMAALKVHLSREGILDKVGAGYLTRSLEFDASDCDVHVRLVTSWRRHGDLKKAREGLEAGLRLFPDSAAMLSEAVETALAGGAFKKAATTARRLLELDPLNRKVRTLLGNAHLSHAGKHIAAGKRESAKKEIEEARSWLGAAAAEQARLQLLQAWTEPEGSPERLRLAQLAVTPWGGGLAAGWRLLREAQGIFVRVDLTSANRLLGEAGIDSAKALAPADILGLVQVMEQELLITRKGADPLVPWRKALVALAPTPLFDAETTVRICEAWSGHKEHDLLEKFATAARKRWPDWPIFVYHAVAARFGKNGCIKADRDFADLERAEELAQKNKDFKLNSRIEALFEADDPDPDFDDLHQKDGVPLQALQAFRGVLEQSIMLDGGKAFLKKARDNFGDALIRQLEKECDGDKKAFFRRLIDLTIAELAGPFGQPFQPAVVINKKPPVKPIKIVKPIAPAQGQGGLFNE